MAKPKSVSVAEAKKSLSELIGRVAYAHDSFTIVKRGRPRARLVPVTDEALGSLGQVKGWMEEDDPFFHVIDEIISDRHSHRPRRVGLPRA